MTLSPIVLFTYNRTEHVRQTVAALQQNALAAESDLFIFSDGWKGEADRDGVLRTRSFLKTISGFRSVHIAESESNSGLAASIIRGVTEVVNRYGKVIVLEDDLITSPYFLTFMNEALEMYAHDEAVCNVNGHVSYLWRFAPDTFLIRFIDSWGWGTWSRAWQLFEPDGQKLLDEMERRNLCHTFDFNGAYKFTRMLRRQVRGENNSWAIRWNASLFLRGKLSVNAGMSMVKNTGFDGSGTHCGSGDLFPTHLYLKKINVQRIQPLEESAQGRAAIARMYRWNNSKLHKAWAEGRFWMRKWWHQLLPKSSSSQLPSSSQKG